MTIDHVFNRTGSKRSGRTEDTLARVPVQAGSVVEPKLFVSAPAPALAPAPAPTEAFWVTVFTAFK
jgi:hypothetical protein